MRCDVRLGAVLTVLAAAIGSATPALAQDRELGWSFTSEFTAVWTGGNASASTFGLNASLRHLWERSELRFDAGGIRTESTKKTRRAIGAPDNFQVDEDSDREKTAENVFVRGFYGHDVSERFFVFGGADWMRNTFAGIKSRLLLSAGAGNTWVENDRVTFKTSYGITYTFEEDVVDNPFTKQNFPGARFAYEYAHTLSSTTDFSSTFKGDWNLDTTDDVRFDLTNSLSVSINSWLALKPSLTLQWRNDPALKEIDLFTLPSDVTPAGTVLVPLDKLDTFFTLALVVKI